MEVCKRGSWKEGKELRMVEGELKGRKEWEYVRGGGHEKNKKEEGMVDLKASEGYSWQRNYEIMK